VRFEEAQDFVGDVGVAAQEARPRLVDDALHEWPHRLQSILCTLQHRLHLRAGHPHPLAQTAEPSIGERYLKEHASHDPRVLLIVTDGP